MTFRKRAVTFVLALIAIITFTALPAAAQTAPAKKPVWAHGTEEYIIEGTVVRDQLTSRWNTSAHGAWAHFITDKTEAGAIVSVFAGQLQGQSAGPFYEYNLPSLKYGHFAVGGHADLNAGDLNDLAKFTLASEFLYKLHIGQSSAVRIAIEVQRAVNETFPDSGQALNQVLFHFGASIGKTPTAVVQ